MATMMLGNLLDHAADLERQVARFYAAVRDTSQDNGVRLLTYYLARHCRHQEQGLADLDSEQRRRIRAIEIEHDTPVPAGPALHGLNLPPDAMADTMTGTMLIQAAIGYDTQLTDFYRGILEQPLTDEARRVLETLIRIEERDIVRLEKMLAMHYFEESESEASVTDH
ncbi:MAG: hypothetical protein ISS31_08110 [Kiritimatiellae bacterium]|nr:hypothetical protein [Kiritimatiellia bacterium]